MSIPDPAHLSWRKSSYSAEETSCVEIAFVPSQWRKSGFSGTETNCVEVALVPRAWRKSSFSGTETSCVEIARAAAAVAIRDSKHPSGPMLVVSPGSFGALLSTLDRSA